MGMKWGDAPAGQTCRSARQLRWRTSSAAAATTVGSKRVPDSASMIDVSNPALTSASATATIRAAAGMDGPARPSGVPRAVPSLVHVTQCSSDERSSGGAHEAGTDLLRIATVFAARKGMTDVGDMSTEADEESFLALESETGGDVARHRRDLIPGRPAGAVLRQPGQSQGHLELGRRGERAREFSGAEHRRTFFLGRRRLGPARQLPKRRQVVRRLRTGMADRQQQRHVRIGGVGLDDVDEGISELDRLLARHPGREEHERALAEIEQISVPLTDVLEQCGEPTVQQRRRLATHPHPPGIGQGGQRERDDARRQHLVGGRGGHLGRERRRGREAGDRADEGSAARTAVAGDRLADLGLVGLEDGVGARGDRPLVAGEGPQRDRVALGDRQTGAGAQGFDGERFTTWVDEDDRRQPEALRQRDVLGDAMPGQTGRDHAVRGPVRISGQLQPGRFERGDDRRLRRRHPADDVGLVEGDDEVVVGDVTVEERERGRAVLGRPGEGRVSLGDVDAGIGFEIGDVGHQRVDVKGLTSSVGSGSNSRIRAARRNGSTRT